MSSFATLAQAREWVKSSAGTSDVKKLNQWVNDIRDRIYLLYTTVDITPHVVECFELQEFWKDCDNCSDKYLGFTLPSGGETVQAMWAGNEHNNVDLHTSWRMWTRDYTENQDSNIASYDIVGRFSTERDPLTKPTRLMIKALSKSDEGAIVTLRYLDPVSGWETTSLKLSTDYQYFDAVVKSIATDGGIVFEKLTGGAILAEDGGRILSKYSCGELIPSYRRIRVDPSCNVSRVNVRYSRSFKELTYDTEVVEIGHKAIFEEMALAKCLRDKKEKTSADWRSIASHEATAVQFLSNKKARNVSPQHQIRLTIPYSDNLSETRRSRRRRRRLR